MYKFGKDLMLMDEKSIFIDERVVIGENVTIYENNRLEGECVIGDGVTLLPGNYIKCSEIGNGSTVSSSNIEYSQVGDGVSVGPYAHLRRGSFIEDGARIGNFVEIKNARIGRGSKVAHLAYVGDADVGCDTNIGCGVIFVNYNGREKNRTTVGDGCFIGSNCNLIAPLTIADRSYITAGTTVIADVLEDDFVIGRARQENKSGRAHKYLKER